MNTKELKRKRIFKVNVEETAVYQQSPSNERMRNLKTEWCAKRVALGLPIYTTLVKYEKFKGNEWVKCSKEEYDKWSAITAFKDLVRIKEIKVNMFNLK